MKTKNNIRVEMVRMKGDLGPFIQVDYVDKDAQKHTGLFLLDTGSNENILSAEIADDMGSLCFIEDGTKTIASISKEVIRAKQAKFSFVLGDNQFDETFCISSELLSIDIEGMTFIGILGNVFLLQNRLVIDYHDFTIHTSDISSGNIDISDWAFYIPMAIGLKIYRVPVVLIKQNEVELVTLVDTGATNNAIANQALTNYEFKCETMESKGVMTGIAGNIDVNDAKVWFTVLSISSNDVTELSHCELFKVLPRNIFTPSEEAPKMNGEQLPPIEALLGAPFMAKEGWVLDFGAKIIYKLKSHEAS